MKKNLLLLMLVLFCFGISLAQNEGAGSQITTSKSTTSTVASAAIPAVNFLPATNIAATSFNMNWTSDVTASAYIIDVATDNLFLNILPGMANLNVGVVTTYNVSNLQSGTRYYYRIKTINYGDISGVHATSSTVTMYSVPVAKPATAVAESTFTANWNKLITQQDAKIGDGNKNERAIAVIIADCYLLDVSTNEFFTSFVTGYQNREIATDTSIKLTGLPEQTYYYRLRAKSASGTTAYSNVIKVQLPIYPTLVVHSELDFGSMEYASFPFFVKKLHVSNTGPVNLTISEILFDDGGENYWSYYPLPIVLEPNSSFDIHIHFFAKNVGSIITKVHLINNSKINDVPVTLKAEVTPRQDLHTLLPLFGNFGSTSSTTVLFDVTNTSQNNMSITGVSIQGDPGSFGFEGFLGTTRMSIRSDNSSPSKSSLQKPQKTNDLGLPVTVKPGETYTVLVKFLPQTSGIKNATLVVETNTSSPLYAWLSGVASGYPKITLSKNELNFGEMSNAALKYDSIIIKNDGSLSLNIAAKQITGADRDAFTIVSGAEAIALRTGESQVVKISALGLLPPGVKNAEIAISSNDPQYSVSSLKLTSSIKNGVLALLNTVEFNNTDMDLFSDTTITIKNTGNIPVTIDNLYLDGAYASDFKIVNTTLPITMQTGEEIKVTVRFLPQGTNLRFARMVIHCTDPTVPFAYLALKGYGLKIQKIFSANGKISFKGAGLMGVTINLSGDSTGSVKSAEDGTYGFSLKLTKSYTITPALKGFVFDPSSKTVTNVSAETINDFTAINNEPSKFALVTPENNKVLPIVYPTKPVVFKWGKSVDPEGLPVTYKLVLSGGIINKQYADLTDTTLTADIMKDLAPGTTYKWYVEAGDGLNLAKTDLSSFTASTSVTDVDVVDTKPVCYSLGQNYPNPFNPSTQIEYSILENGNVTIDVYNTLGSKVKTLVNQVQPAGRYKITFDAANMPSGLYFYRIQAGNFISMKKMILMK